MPRGQYTRPSLTSSFWRRVDDTGDCWLWTGSTDKDGYGKFHVETRSIQAHRFSFALHHGWMPIFVCHSCDVPGCVNPAHLFAGDALLNAADSVAKGRRWHPPKKLTDEQVSEIRARWTPGGPISQRKLAQEYDVCPTTIHNLVSGSKTSRP